MGLIDQHHELMAFIDSSGCCLNCGNNSVGVIDHSVVFVSWPSFYPLLRHQRRFRISAVKVLKNTGIPVTLDSLQNWESGRRNPRADVALALADFLRGDPTVPKKSARQPRAQ